MTSTNFFGNVVISGGVVSSTNPVVHYHTYDLNSASSVDAHSQGPHGAREVPSSTNSPTPYMPPSVADTPSPTSRPQRSFPRSFSMDSGSHQGHEAPNFPTDPRRSSTHPSPLPPLLEDSLGPLPPHMRRSYTLPPSSVEGRSGLHGPPPDWPANETEAPDVTYGFRVPIRRDSAIPFQPIGTPLQHKPIPRQHASEYAYDQTYGPMPTAPTAEPQPLTPPWGGHHSFEGYGMPVPMYGSTTSPATSDWPVDDRDIENTDGMEQNHYPGQIYG